jgi:hypothetical protein
MGGIVKRSGLNSAVLLALTGLGLTGCFFSVHSNTCANDASLCVVPESSKVGGKVADGTVAYATVTLDTNDDRICAAGEPVSQTDASGNYSFPASLGQHMVCAAGGVDIATGLPLVGVLMAPAGSTQVTPLTNLVMAQLNAASPPVAGKASPISAQDAYSASAAIADQLGLGGGESLLTADPVTAADSNPALLQTTAALQALMVQTVSLLQATGGDDTAEAGSPNTNALYAHAGSALAGLLKAPAPALTKATLGSVATNLLHDSLSSVQSDPALLANLSGLASINPDSLAAFAGPTLGAMTNAVAAASTTTLLVPNQYNQAALQQSNVALANTVAALGPVLLVSGVSLGGGITLADIASAALPLSNIGVPKASPGATTQSIITQANDSIQLPPGTITALNNANQLNNVTRIAGVRINCNASSCPSATLGYNKPLVASMTSVGPFTNVVISLQEPVGLALKGGNPSTALPVGTAAGKPIAGTEQESNISIAVVRTDNSSSQQLTFTLSHVVLYQTQGTLANGDPFIALTGKVRLFASADGKEPATSLNVKGTDSKGTSYSVDLSPSAAASIVTFLPVLGSATNSSDIKLDISEMIRKLGTSSTYFPALSDFSSGLAGSGKTFLISTEFSGLTLATLSNVTPARSKGFAMQVGF